MIPPRKYDSTDISDFAKRYDEKAWKELFVQIRTRLSNKDYWVYTHGGGEDILHIRFEPGRGIFYCVCGVVYCVCVFVLFTFVVRNLKLILSSANWTTLPKNYILTPEQI